MKIVKMFKTALQQALSMFVISKNGKLHTCQYCGAETTQPDEVCYAAPKPAPKPVAVCENCRFNKPKNYHDIMWCRDCQQKNHFEILGNKDFINLTK